MRAGEPIPLWADETPGLNTAEPVEVPAITPYPVQSDKPVGAVVICPGGGYSHRAPHEGEPVALKLNQAGIAAFVCAYRVAPYRHPWPLADAHRAVRWVRHHAREYGVDTNHVGILGFSAGGHLAATTATHHDPGDRRAADPIDRQSCRPDAAVLCYAVVSMTQFAHVGCRNNLLGPDAGQSLWVDLSGEQQVRPDTPPAFLWHTADDPGVPVGHSLLYATALRDHGVPFELHVYQTGRHGLGLAPDDPHLATWSDLCCEWLKGLGF